MKVLKLAYEIRDRLKILGINACVLEHEIFHVLCHIANESIYIRISDKLPTKEDVDMLVGFIFPAGIQREFWVKIADRQGHFRRFILANKELMEHFQIYIPSLTKTPKASQAGCVYFMLNRRKEEVKIGYSNNAKRRLYEIKSYQTDGLELIGKILTDNPIDLEKEIHKKFAPHKIRGEWFEFSDSIKNYIKTYCQ